MIGQTLGPYAVVAKLGEGGMGEVYRAHDARLGRHVALKILPDAYASDPERLARFRREAQTLASLNHPNIAQIYGLEDSGDRHALVLELVEGPTLAEAIAAADPGAGLGMRESLDIARQLVDALDAAHALGIVHRDLKPANIKVRTNPNDQTITVKVLDFGLAKALAPEDSDVANSPTFTSPATARGVILGTAGYMAPEQAMGKVADKRADIWAFGVVLYEMLVGRRPFHGDDAGTLLTESLTAEPDLRSLPAGTPANVRRLIRRCLEKNPRRRLRDIGDARIEMDDAGAEADGGTTLPRNAPAGSRVPAWIAWGLVAALGLALGVVTLRPRPAVPSQAPPVRFPLASPDGRPLFGDFAISPDGRAAAFNVMTRGHSAIWIRTFETLRLTELPGSANARSLFWSPDSRSIGFFADGKIKTINVASGVHAVACDPPGDGGAAWGPDGLILYGGPTGIRACGRESPMTVIEGAETGHRSPWFLPDGRHFIYLAVTASSAELRVGSIDGQGSPAVVGPSDSNAVYSDGHLLFVRSGVLLAQPFDTATLATRGDAFRIAEGTVGVPVATRRARLSASNVGTIGFAVLDDRPALLTWFNRAGVSTGTVGAPTVFLNLDLSPDGQRLALSRRITISEPTDIWVLDLARGGQARRVTDHPGFEFDPIWSRDGRTLVFNSDRNGSFDFYRRPADSSGADELLVSHKSGLTTPAWSPRRDLLLYSVGAGTVNADIWMLSLDAGGKPSPFLATSFSESQPAFSPDGRWVTYTSNASGRDEVYVRAFEGDTTQLPVSLEGGSAPRWSGDGREIFFLAADRSMMAARVDTTTGIRIANPVRLFDTEIVLSDGHPYVVSNDGQRFLFGVRQGPPARIGASILTNWLAATRR
jgi:Tol biopolymer transport system component